MEVIIKKQYYSIIGLVFIISMILFYIVELG
ncbi:putative membrane protein [Clostridium bornimense]|uniref:Putative membrane protein n=1 Tax=Clostridium bornimense TaxID=1216932 RepID=W6SDE3_9CLOT|nr:putative membrane protein [Clostridium bornimense]